MAGKAISQLKSDSAFCVVAGLRMMNIGDHVQTDSQGRFQFQTVAERRFLRPDLLSANPHISQVLEVYFDGQPHTFWAFQKQNFDLGTEAKGGILKIECDLSKFEQNSYGRIVRCEHNGVQKYE